MGWLRELVGARSVRGYPGNRSFGTGRLGRIYDSRMAEKIRVSQVFVTANPDYTYTERSSARLEQALRDHIDEKDKLLLITGPTKSGKTVLVDHVVPEEVTPVVKIEGPMVTSDADVWKQVVDELNVFTDVGTEASRTEVSTDVIGADAGLNVGVLRAGGRLENRDGTTTSASKTRSLSRTPETAGREALLNSGAALIIDDFHHVNPEVQRTLIRQLKSIVAKRAAPIVLVAVPHHAADVVRAEREMQGRLKHVTVPDWTIDELKEIAQLGFKVLNVDCPDSLSHRLAEVAWGSPHLMQVLCRELAKVNGIRAEQERSVQLLPPPSWDDFLCGVAEENTDARTTEKLATGRQPRNPRKQRRLVGGGTADLYRSVLAAVASTGPKRLLSYNEIRDALATVLVDAPQSNEITDTLNKLSGIASEEARDAYGRVVDPVLEYDGNDRKLMIIDPFFAFRLRWAPSVLEPLERG